MKRKLLAIAILPVGAAVLFGCASVDLPETVFSESIWNPLGLRQSFAASEPPVRIGLVNRDTGICDARIWWDVREQLPWTKLCRALSTRLKRQVQIEELKPFQIAAHLESGRIDFALLSDDDYERMVADGDRSVVIAQAEPLERSGLIVASAKSSISSIGQIKGKRFAFGPRGDPVLHCGAAAALSAAGVSLDDIQREVFPPNALQYHLLPSEAAAEVVYGFTGVGVIDRREYERFPESGGKMIPLSFSKDQFVVLAETPPVDFGPFVASPKTDPKLVETVRTFLLDDQPRTVKALFSLGLARFHPPQPPSSARPSMSGERDAPG
ncbi:MAG: PhnD/SsuA/transferrin family substrate-binding protein [Planctomycetes bacterium]|nr:PhnD/SsuA/transferrin family substrate-binding protein [Planctomycetota bacterium]